MKKISFICFLFFTIAMRSVRLSENDYYVDKQCVMNNARIMPLEDTPKWISASRDNINSSTRESDSYRFNSQRLSILKARQNTGLQLYRELSPYLIEPLSELTYDQKYKAIQSLQVIVLKKLLEISRLTKEKYPQCVAILKPNKLIVSRHASLQYGKISLFDHSECISAVRQNLTFRSFRKN